MGRDGFRTALRWTLTTVAVAVLVVSMLRLSRWQWHKHVGRDTQISRQQRDLAAPPISFDRLVGTPAVLPGEEWRRVELRGRFDDSRQVVVTLRTVGGLPGSEVLTPLHTDAGVDVLVDRGFHPIPDDAPPGSAGPAPAAPSGPVVLTGYLRLSEHGSRPPSLDGRVQTFTAIDPAVIATVLPYRLLDGYVLLDATSPAGRAGLQQVRPPTYDPGPYLSYSVQWVIFCAIAVGGLLFLAVDEVGGGRIRSRLRPPATAGLPGPTADGAPAAQRPVGSDRAGPRPVGRDRVGPRSVGQDRVDRPVGPVSGRGQVRRPAGRSAPSSSVGVLAGATRAGSLPDDFYDDRGPLGGQAEQVTAVTPSDPDRSP